ncbi:MAG TPA: DUF362 domain-containing protein [Polyangiaceae bacterium]|nr:DUF362 domain-containing protein [Polyangiaceae bacterium]
MTQRSRVAVLRVTPERVLDDIERLCALAGLRDALSPTAPTILKDNISWHYPFPGANTTPWQLEGAVQALQHAGFDRLSCVQNETVVTDAVRGEVNNLYVPVLKRLGVPILYNFEPSHMKWVKYAPKARLRVLDRVFPDGLFVPDYFFGKNIVHLPTAKCHVYTTTTGAMKNAFGGLLGKNRHYAHAAIHETLVDLLALQKEIHPGLFAIMDATTAGDGPGPRTLRPVVKGFMLASADQVAIDAVAARMMGFDPLQIDYIRGAQEAGLGVGRPSDIELVGDDIADENWHFSTGDNVASRVGKALWFGRLRPLQGLLFHTPLVHAFVLASALYHDHYRWPWRDRPRFDRWKSETAWGRLFAEYERAAQPTLTHDPVCR